LEIKRKIEQVMINRYSDSHASARNVEKVITPCLHREAEKIILEISRMTGKEIEEEAVREKFFSSAY